MADAASLRLQLIVPIALSRSGERPPSPRSRKGSPQPARDLSVVENERAVQNMSAGLKRTAHFLCTLLLVGGLTRALEATPAETADAVDSPSTSQATRRTMLNLHQGFGLATWAFWLATNIAGDQALDHLRPANEELANVLLLQDPRNNLPIYYYLMRTSEWKVKGGSPHRSLAGITMGLYFATAGLSLFAPARFEAAERGGWDAMSTHKLLAVFHFAAMLSLPVLGARIEHHGPAAARDMEAVGWAGFSAFSVAVAVFYF